MHESGALLGLRGALRAAAGEHWVLAAHGTWLQGNVAYDGHTQLGQAHTTSTDQRLLHTGLQLHRCTDGCRGRFGYLAGIALANWQREIRPRGGVSGLDETYRWWEFELGADARLYRRASGRVELALSALAIRAPHVKVDLRDSGFGQPGLALGERNGARAILRWLATRVDRMQWFAALTYERWEFGASEQETVSNGTAQLRIREPESRSEHVALSFGLRLPVN